MGKEGLVVWGNRSRLRCRDGTYRRRCSRSGGSSGEGWHVMSGTWPLLALYAHLLSSHGDCAWCNCNVLTFCVRAARALFVSARLCDKVKIARFDSEREALIASAVWVQKELSSSVVSLRNAAISCLFCERKVEISAIEVSFCCSNKDLIVCSIFVTE